jgi:glucarate dehydratase
MKITRIKVTDVNVPFDAPFWWTAGLYGNGSKSIIEVETDEGVVGLGEAPWWHFGEVIEKEIAPALIGADPLDIADCEARCVPPYQITANTGENASAIAFGSVELALIFAARCLACRFTSCLAARCARTFPSPNTSPSAPKMARLAAK